MNFLRRASVTGALAVLLGSGCETTEKYFKITSFPEGATVYVDGEPRGQTNFKRLEVDFEREDKLVTVRLEKDGYQTTGIVLSKRSPQEIAFFLDEAPSNQEILQVLKDILKVLDRISTEINQSLGETEQ